MGTQPPHTPASYSLDSMIMLYLCNFAGRIGTSLSGLMLALLSTHLVVCHMIYISAHIYAAAFCASQFLHHNEPEATTHGEATQNKPKVLHKPILSKMLLLSKLILFPEASYLAQLCFKLSFQSWPISHLPLK